MASMKQGSKETQSGRHRADWGCSTSSAAAGGLTARCLLLVGRFPRGRGQNKDQLPQDGKAVDPPHIVQ